MLEASFGFLKFWRYTKNMDLVIIFKTSDSQNFPLLQKSERGWGGGKKKLNPLTKIFFGQPPKKIFVERLDNFFLQKKKVDRKKK